MPLIMEKPTLQTANTRGKCLVRCMLLLTVFCSNWSNAQPYTVGNTYNGYNNLVQYVYGNLPIIITAPHGGLQTGGLPDRACANIVTTTDANTDQLALAVQAKLTALFGKVPHLVVCNLKRSKIDVNRPLDEGTCNNATAAISWNDYHNFISAARNTVLQQYGKGLLIDLHGHGHTIQRVELGYNLSASQLANTDAYLNGSTPIAGSTIRSLVGNNLTGQTHAHLIRGPFSFGTYLQASGYPAVPSVSIPNPGTEPYFSGGYTVETWGSKDGGTLDAIQIESNYTGLRDNSVNINNYATALANSIKAFIEKHYFALGTLPLPLVSFTGVKDGASALLQWTTYDERNAKEFVIQRNTVGVQWDSIGKLLASGTIGSTASYSYRDLNPGRVQNRYRLVQRNNDGQVSISKLVLLDFSSQVDALTVYPNPTAGGWLNFSVNISGPVKLYNSVGQLVYEKSFSTNIDQILLPTLPPGLYGLRTAVGTIMLLISH